MWLRHIEEEGEVEKEEKEAEEKGRKNAGELGM